MKITYKVKVWEVEKKSYKTSRNQCSNCGSYPVHAILKKVNSFGIKIYGLHCNNCSAMFEISPQFQAIAKNYDYYNVKPIEEKKVHRFYDSRGNSFDPDFHFFTIALGMPFMIAILSVIALFFGETAFNLVFWFFLFVCSILVSSMPGHLVERQIAVVIGTVLNYYVFTFFSEIMGKPSYFTFIAIFIYFTLGSTTSYYTRPIGELEEGFQRDKESFNTIYKEGVQAYQNKNFSQAGILIDLALKFNNGDEKASLLLGEVYVRLNLLEKAERVFDPLAFKGGQEVKSYYLMAQNAEIESKPDLAEFLFKKVVDLDPEYTEAWIDLFNIYFASKQYELAEATINTILKYDPENSKVRELLTKFKRIGEINHEKSNIHVNNLKQQKTEEREKTGIVQTKVTEAQENSNDTFIGEPPSKTFDYFAESVSFAKYNLNFVSLGKVKFEAAISGMETDTKFTSTQIDGLVRAIDKARNPLNSKIEVFWHNVREGKSSDKFENINSTINCEGMPYIYMYTNFPQHKLWFRFRGDQDLDFEKDNTVKMFMRTPKMLEVEDVVIKDGQLTDEKLKEIYSVIDKIKKTPADFEFTAHFFYDPLLPTIKEYTNKRIDPTVEVAFDKEHHFRKSLDFTRMTPDLRRRFTLELLLFYIMVHSKQATQLEMVLKTVSRKDFYIDEPPLSHLKSQKDFIDSMKMFQDFSKMYDDPLQSLNLMFSTKSKVNFLEFLPVYFGASVVLTEELLFDPNNVSLLGSFMTWNIHQIHQNMSQLAKTQKLRKRGDFQIIEYEDPKLESNETIDDIRKKFDFYNPPNHLKRRLTIEFLIFWKLHSVMFTVVGGFLHSVVTDPSYEITETPAMLYASSPEFKSSLKLFRELSDQFSETSIDEFLDQPIPQRVDDTEFHIFSLVIARSFAQILIDDPTKIDYYYDLAKSDYKDRQKKLRKILNKDVIVVDERGSPSDRYDASEYEALEFSPHNLHYIDYNELVNHLLNADISKIVGLPYKKIHNFETFESHKRKIYNFDDVNSLRFMTFWDQLNNINQPCSVCELPYSARSYSTKNKKQERANLCSFCISLYFDNLMNVNSLDYPKKKSETDPTLQNGYHINYIQEFKTSLLERTEEDTDYYKNSDAKMDIKGKFNQWIKNYFLIIHETDPQEMLKLVREEPKIPKSFLLKKHSEEEYRALLQSLDTDDLGLLIHLGEGFMISPDFGIVDYADKIEQLYKFTKLMDLFGDHIDDLNLLEDIAYEYNNKIFLSSKLTDKIVSNVEFSNKSLFPHVLQQPNHARYSNIFKDEYTRTNENHIKFWKKYYNELSTQTNYGIMNRYLGLVGRMYIRDGKEFISQEKIDERNYYMRSKLIENNYEFLETVFISVCESRDEIERFEWFNYPSSDQRTLLIFLGAKKYKEFAIKYVIPTEYICSHHENCEHMKKVDAIANAGKHGLRIRSEYS